MNIKDYIMQENTNSVNLDNEADVLVIAQSSYFQFEKERDFNFPIKLSEVIIDTETNHKNRMKKANQSLIQLMVQSERFGALEIIDFESNIDDRNEQQFSAITYLVNRKVLCIAFRGTDSTVTGWKEDLNMSFSEQIPSQILGVQYVNRLLSQYDYPVYICGHSKGGNIAVFSSAFCEKNVKERIIKVYNFDGPGFHSNILSKSEYIEILPKIVKYIPKASIIGKLMDTHEKEIIVKSNHISIFQHDVFNWIVEGNQLARVQDISKPARHFSKSLQKWLEEITDAQRKYVIDELYTGFKLLNIDTFEDVWQFLTINTLKTLVAVFNSTDPEFKIYLKRIAKQFILLMIDFKE